MPLGAILGQTLAEGMNLLSACQKARDTMRAKGMTKLGGTKGEETCAEARGGAKSLRGVEENRETPEPAPVTTCPEHSVIKDSLRHRQWLDISNSLQNSLA